MRYFTGSEDRAVHKGIRTPFPDATDRDFRKAVAFAQIIDPDVLVLVLFGKDMSIAIRQATIQGLKQQGVAVQICANTLRGRKIPRDGLYDTSDADIVPSGVAELSRLQQLGYTYIKP